MTIQLLHFEGCPSWKQALTNLHAALANMDWDPEIEIIDIEDDEAATRYAFQGSPSIKYQGVDLWEVKQDEYHIDCRVYNTPQGLRGVPTVQMLQERLEELRKSQA